jgi:hypothetical protein
MIDTSILAKYILDKEVASLIFEALDTINSSGFKRWREAEINVRGGNVWATWANPERNAAVGITVGEADNQDKRVIGMIRMHSSSAVITDDVVNRVAKLCKLIMDTPDAQYNLEYVAEQISTITGWGVVRQPGSTLLN